MGKWGTTTLRSSAIKKLILCFFGGIRTRDSQSICMGYFSLFFFLLSFCNKAVWVQCWLTFSALSHFNLSGLRHVSFSLWFSLGLLVQGRMGHIMIISFTVHYLVLEIEMIHSGMKFSFNYVSMFGLNQLTSG